MPRAGLSQLKVIEEAEALADEVGLARLTLMALATRLGVRMPSLYKHIAGMDALQQEVAIRARVELGGVLALASAGRSEGDALVTMSAAYRAWARRHPGRYAATVRAPDIGDDVAIRVSDDIMKVVIAVLAGFGIAGDDVIDATRTWRAAVHGFVALEAAGGFGMPQDIDRSYHRLVNGLAEAFRRWPTGT